MYTESFVGEQRRHSSLLHIPEDGKDLADHLQLLGEAVRTLPIEGCAFQFDEHTGEAVFKAPEGMRFRIGGYFHTWVASDEFDVRYRAPISSTTAWQEEHKGRFFDEDGNSYFDTDEEDPPVDYFEGDTLTIGLRAPWLSPDADHTTSDGWKNHYCERWSDARPPQLSIHVADKSTIETIDLRPYYRSGVDIPAASDGSGGGIYSFDRPMAHYAWCYPYADTSLDRAEVELVPLTEPSTEPTIEVPDSERLHKLWAPLWHRDDHDPEAFIEALRSAIIGEAHPERASHSRPFFRVSGGGFDIDELVSLERAGKLKTTTRLIDIHTPEGHLYWQNEQRNKRARSLTVIEGSGYISLHALAQEFSDPEWLEKRLRSYWGRHWDDYEHEDF